VRTWLPQLLGFVLAASSALASAPLANTPVETPLAPRVFVIPVRDQIGSAVLYVVRRGLKEAIEAKADAVILDMKTPGGALDSTLEIMEAIGKFPGPTYTYINTEAISAGAFIAATTEEIWFAPGGIIGAAAPVSGTGQDVEATMKAKIVSYLKARVRAMSEGKGYRGQVISAMIDETTEFKIGEEVIKGKGELLSLTAVEATKTYGDPPRPLLGAGIAASIDELVAAKFGPGPKTITTLQMTWSEEFAVWLNTIAPFLMGLGLLALFIEFKTPGFGAFGITGIALLAVVFLSNYVAGLSGHEPVLCFALGLLLVGVELFFFPGVVVLAMAGLALMLVSLVWSMADLWPNEPLSVAWDGNAFASPLMSLALGLLIAVGLGVALARFIPRGWVWDRLVVQSTVAGAAQSIGGGEELAVEAGRLVGHEGLAVTALRPSGQVEIAGRRYEARAEIGEIPRGRPIVVRGQSDFGLVVEEKA
jgi:membrane-bound serine protease (ClpP class)